MFVAEVEGARGSALRDLSDQLRQREGAAAVVLASADDGKVALVVNLDKSLAELDAVAIVRELGPLIGGGGGGRPTLAEAGGKNVDGVRDALAAGRDRLSRRPRVSKLLALDYGSARTGVAVSDPTGTVARPVTTVERAGSEAGFARLLAVIAAEEPELVVVGMPLTLRGEHGEQARETAEFVERLRGALVDAGRDLRRAVHVGARGRRRRPCRGAPPVELPRVAERPELTRRDGREARRPSRSAAAVSWRCWRSSLP